MCMAIRHKGSTSNSAELHNTPGRQQHTANPMTRSQQAKLRQAKKHELAQKVPYVDSPQLNAIRHAQVPGKIYLYITDFRSRVDILSTL